MSTLPTDIPVILDRLADGPTLLAAFVADIPADRMHLRRLTGAWTIAEHVEHLAHVQPLMLARFERMLAEERAVFVPYIPSDDEADEAAPRPDVDAALARFAQVRARQVELLRGADARAWAREHEHPEYERFGLRMFARHLMMHDVWHMYRMEELWLTRDPWLTRMEG